MSDAPLLDVSAVPWCAAETRPRPSIIFPTIVDTDAFRPALRHPIDRFYMYYAPHTSQGVGLATAPHPEGPWTPYPANPVLRLAGVPGLRGHLSSPELVYRPDQPDEPFWLYVHGYALPKDAGQHTAVVASTDGLHWRALSPELVLTASPEQSGDANTAAYVRIWQRNGWLYGLYKSSVAHGLARSRDGLSWEHWPHNPVIGPEAAHGEHGRIRHTGILVDAETLTIFYSAPTRPDLTREEIMLATFGIAGDDWLAWGPLRRHGIVLSPEREWEGSDLRDPFPFLHEGTLYLYYTGGHEQGVGLALATPRA